MKNDSRLSSTGALIVPALIVGALFFALSITRVKAQVVARVTIPAGRGVNEDAKVDIHNALRLEAEIYTVSRGGSDGTYARRKMRMDLLNPSGQVVSTVIAEIGHDSSQTVNGANGTRDQPYLLKAPAPLGGSSVCSRWKVRIGDAETGAIPNPDPSSQPVTALVQFYVVQSGPPSTIIPAPAKFGIVQSGTEERNISIGFGGQIIVQANWDTDEFTLDNYPLKFSLLNSHGNVVASNTGYSRDSLILGISSDQRMKIDYLTTCGDFGGAQSWKIRVRGSSHGKVKNVDLKATISPFFYLDAVF
jgi:hypothetical protein